MDAKQYQKMVDQTVPKTNSLKNCFFAFVIGGGICVLGQILINLYKAAGLDEQTAGALCSVSLVLISVTLTACHLYDDIAKVAGAGSLVPITGFANAVVSPAIEFKSEGQILGVGAKMFTIAGPVLVFGISTSVLYGVILWIVKLFL